VTNTWAAQYAMRFKRADETVRQSKVRQAVLYGLSQKEFLDAKVGNPE